ncbi:MAG: glycosyltransferase [Deltaproteobacteria bacterium]|nr:glycosyltransferase [Deltaproteobacteria bacterium]MCB9487187.1 glycosyltransferase [Deltaproteobacteria bacterium]
MRVAHIRDTWLRWSETFIYDIVTRHRDVEAYVFCERRANEDQFAFDRVDALADQNAAVRAVDETRRRLGRGYGFYARQARARNIDLIHAHFGTSGYHALPAKRAVGRPLITSFYGQDLFETCAQGKWKRRYARLFAEGDLFLALSESMRRDLIELGCPVEKIRIYRLGIDLTDFAVVERPPTERPRLLCVARLVEKKGIDVLIRAFAELRRRDVEAELTVIGDGPMEATLRALADELDVAERIEWQDHIPFAALPSAMAKADIFCLPSCTDRFGGKDEISMVIKEAMGTALPVVTTRHAGIPEKLEDGVHALLVPEKDVTALADALAALVVDPNRRRELGLAGRQRVEEVWEIHRQVAELEAIYRETAAGR